MKRLPRTNATPAVSYTNRRGDTYFLHRGLTKTGKPRYFMAKTVGPGAQREMPVGYEFCESVNAIVSVRRQSSSVGLVSEADLTISRQELARHPRLHRYVVERHKDELVIYEPMGIPSEQELRQMCQLYGRDMESIQRRVETMLPRVRYTPVMKFLPNQMSHGEYLAYRWLSRGEGGWMLLSSKPLRELCQAYFSAIGTDRFFELY